MTKHLDRDQFKRLMCGTRWREHPAGYVAPNGCGGYHAIAFVAALPISLGLFACRSDAADAIVEAHAGDAAD